jgi:fermentation-respiration switch protein FrsA (DUF1100 family)
VFVPDYRGYGESAGEVSPSILHDDGVAAVDYVSGATGVSAEQIAMIGLSLGAAVLTHTNPQTGGQVMVIEDMFHSANRMGDDGTGLDLPVGWFFEDEYANHEQIRAARSPVFVIHAADDDFVDTRYSRELYDAAPDPKELWNPEGANHADTHLVHPDEYRDRVIAWIDRWPGADSP